MLVSVILGLKISPRSARTSTRPSPALLLPGMTARLTSRHTDRSRDQLSATGRAEENESYLTAVASFPGGGNSPVRVCGLSPTPGPGTVRQHARLRTLLPPIRCSGPPARLVRVRLVRRAKVGGWGEAPKRCSRRPPFSSLRSLISHVDYEWWSFGETLLSPTTFSPSAITDNSFVHQLLERHRSVQRLIDVGAITETREIRNRKEKPEEKRLLLRQAHAGAG